MNDIQKITNKLKKYFELLLKSNIKYAWWYEGDIINDQGPFYYEHNSENKEAPSIQRIQKEGINCAGFLNVCFKHLQINLPDEGGGTEGWFEHYKNKQKNNQGKFFEINTDFIYPVGTLLLRDYHNEEDQGHVAMVYDSSKKLKDTKIIHAYSSSAMNRELNDPGIIVEDFSISHSWFNGTYTHVVLPYQWMC